MFNRVRRRLEERLDQAWTLARWKLRAGPSYPRFDGDPRFALLTVNRSTTRYLKLMLLTLCQQSALSQVVRIVICDNRSRDGGGPFLRRLAARVARLHLVENQFFLNHARGMRRCIDALTRLESGLAASSRSNLWLCCDTDLVFRNPATLVDLGRRFVHDQAALAGELRRHHFAYPEAQASFVAVRADWYTRPGIVPWVNHGSPSYWMQRSIWRAHGRVVDFPSNHGGYVLHRGRAAVAAIQRHDRLSSYAHVPTTAPHFMGVRDGAFIWRAIEAEHERWLDPAAEDELLDHLARRLGPR